MRHSLLMRFARDHPTAAGHFPGNPIIPGAVLLDEVLRALAADAGEDIAGRYRIRSAKFLYPVRPGDSIVIRWEASAAGETRVECRLVEPERLVMTGTMLWQAAL